MKSRYSTVRHGTTLVELLVVLVLVGILAVLVGPAFLNADPPPPTVGRWSADLSRVAIATGRDTTLVRSIGGHVVVMTARPDGVVFSDSAGHHAWWMSGGHSDAR